MTYRASRGSPHRRSTSYSCRLRWAKRYVRAWRDDAYQKKLDRAPRHHGPSDFWEQAREHGSKAGNGWEGQLGGACPVQGEGTVDGLEWYFRARGESWSFEVFRPGGFEGLPVQDVVFDRSGETFGGPYSASWIGAKHAWSLIRTCINEWRQGQRKAK